MKTTASTLATFSEVTTAVSLSPQLGYALAKSYAGNLYQSFQKDPSKSEGRLGFEVASVAVGGPLAKAGKVTEGVNALSKAESAASDLEKTAGFVSISEGPSNVVQIGSREEFRASSLSPEPNTVYQYDGLEFTTDGAGRSVNSSGQLSLGNGGNRFYDDYKLGYPHNADALPGDIGFHAGGDQFGFPGGPLNIFAGNAELNSASGAYGAFERDVLRPLVADPNNTVTAQFQRVFNPGNMTTRPNAIVVIYKVNDGPSIEKFFINTAAGER